MCLVRSLASPAVTECACATFGARTFTNHFSLIARNFGDIGGGEFSTPKWPEMNTPHLTHNAGWPCRWTQQSDWVSLRLHLASWTVCFPSVSYSDKSLFDPNHPDEVVRVEVGGKFCPVGIWRKVDSQVLAHQLPESIGRCLAVAPCWARQPPVCRHALG